MELFPDLATMDACLVYNDADQTALDSVGVFLGFNQEVFATPGMHDNVTDNSRITIVTDGKYLINGAYILYPDPNGWRYTLVIKNGVDEAMTYNQAPDGSNGSSVIVTAVLDLIAGDYVELLTYQTSGSNLTIPHNGIYLPVFAAMQLGT
jgi:hypothetical protein